MNIIVGLGNPDAEYIGTRHNIGRTIVETFAKSEKLGDFRDDKKSETLALNTEWKNKKIKMLLPNAYMNKSGKALVFLKGKKKALLDTLVIHDDLDLPLGTLKLSVGKSSGGHKGVESVIKTVGTNEFGRLRVGISPKDSKGRAKKPIGEEKVVKFVLGKFKGDDETEIKKVIKRGVEAVARVIEKGVYEAMNEVNRN